MRPGPASADDGLAGPSRQTIEGLLRAVVAAPSEHNTQPWRFSTGPARDLIKVSADPASYTSLIPGQPSRHPAIPTDQDSARSLFRSK